MDKRNIYGRIPLLDNFFKVQRYNIRLYMFFSFCFFVYGLTIYFFGKENFCRQTCLIKNEKFKKIKLHNNKFICICLKGKNAKK